MKTCVGCKTAKPLDDFAKAARNADGLQDRCRECFSVYNAKRYSNDPERFKKIYNDRRRGLIERVNKIKDKPCLDCRESLPVVCMDFDHTSDNKVMGVSEMVRRGRRWETIEAEIAKCDVVCANCHRIRTAKREGVMWAD